MKETIKINLGLRLFDFDSDAYERLKRYLDSLKNYFQKSPKEADEILQDIEQRMADLFEERKSDKKLIITADDVDEVIKLMGTIEDFEFDAETSDIANSSENSGPDYSSEYTQKENRRLHRDIDHNILGGVCSGMAAYFNVDVVWVRLAFVLFFIMKGLGLLAYIILWIVVPEARTTAQKLQMKGQPVTVENIEQSVKDEYNKVRANVSRYSKSESFRRVQSTSAEVFSSLGLVLGTVLKVILIIAGISLAIAGIFLILGLLTIAPFNDIPNVSFHNLPFWGHIDPIFHDVPLFAFAIALLVLVPVIGIITALFRAIFNLKRGNSIISAFFWTIWSLALVFIIVTIISGQKIFSCENTVEDKAILNIADNKTLVVLIDEKSFSSYRISHYNVFGKEVIYNHESDRCYIKPNFVVSNSSDSFFYLKTNRNSSFAFAENSDHFFDVDYSWKLNGNTLALDQYFNVEDDHVWSVPRMNITLMVPKGRKVIMKGSANELFEMKRTDNDTVSCKEISF